MKFTTRRAIAALAITGTSLLTGGALATMLTGTANAQTSTTTTPSPSAPAASTATSNEDATHEATETAAQEAAENLEKTRTIILSLT